jgi:hypothetical protein
LILPSRRLNEATVILPYRVVLLGSGVLFFLAFLDLVSRRGVSIQILVLVHIGRFVCCVKSRDFVGNTEVAESRSLPKPIWLCSSERNPYALHESSEMRLLEKLLK